MKHDRWCWAGTKRLLWLTAAATVASCAYSDTGGIDYRRANLIDKWNSKRVNDGTASRKNGNGTAVAGPLLPRDVSWRNWTAPEADLRLKEGDSISIRLDHAYINYCMDSSLDLTEKFSRFKKNCEVVVVANACEAGRSGDKCGLAYGPSATRNGRVIYFSDDIRERQHFNFNNMPLYGPITYQGGPIVLDFSLLDVDATSEQTRAILETLADLGGKVPYPPASAGLSVLGQIGGALVQNSPDDTIFRYTMVLDPTADIAPGVAPDVVHARLAAGHYVLVRQHERDKRTPWEQLQYDENDGRLYKVNNNDQNNGKSGVQEYNGKSGVQEYDDGTYLVFSILRNESSVDVDLAQQSFAELRAELEEEDRARAAAIRGTAKQAASTIDKTFKDRANALQQRELARAQTGVFDRLRQDLTIIREAHNAEAETPLRRDGGGRAFDMLTVIQEALKSKTPALSPEQIGYLLRELRTISGTTKFEQFTAEKIEKASVKDVANLVVPPI